VQEGEVDDDLGYGYAIATEMEMDIEIKLMIDMFGDISSFSNHLQSTD
jgi:hypothetical protein